jgi:uncharacterized delta-60 repeat protein
MKRALLVLLFFALFNEKALSQAGDLDSTFGVNGIVAPFSDGDATDIAVQQDGKILVCGYGGIGTDGFTVIRLNDSGSLDSTFGTNGISKTTVGAGSNLHGKIAIQSDGKIVVAGTCATFDGYWSCALLRLQENGDLDFTFGTAGKLVYSLTDPHQFSNYSEGIAIGTDQKITTTVSTSIAPAISVFGVARFTSNGAFDNTFGSNGIVLTPIGNQYASPTCIQVQPDGKTVVGGGSYSTTDCSFAIARYNANGSLDNNFNGDGKDTIYFYNTNIYNSGSFAYDLIIQPDGKIVLAGETGLSNDTTGYVAIAKYNSDGTLDNNFGIGGKKSLLIPGFSRVPVFSAINQSDGKIVLAGYCSPSSFNVKNTIMVMRVLQDGNLDSSFGNNGVVVTSLLKSYILSIAMDKQQRIVGAGYSYELGFIALRYLSGLEVGVIDLTTNQQPVLIYPNPVTSEANISYVLIDDYNITISLFDMLGREVQRFITGVAQNKGEHSMALSINPSLSTGEYLISISDGKYSQGIKLVLQR